MVVLSVYRNYPHLCECYWAGPIQGIPHVLEMRILSCDIEEGTGPIRYVLFVDATTRGYDGCGPHPSREGDDSPKGLRFQVNCIQ
ncbi:hypothetical protein OUZ56_013901 [Daphnia magna]|uniref:Uncharacterized protein n=1 Tax=Daphnia magna TaxID=35525 RepID=A0ABQ9Z8D6_9CRUS|nr:hypothetical protein OUZ56_013901 [Daphnia magna]